MKLDPTPNGSGFSYTYSAKEQAELKRIRDKYRPATPDGLSAPDKLARLRALDASVTKKGTVVALIVGIASTLILGMGMSLIMTDLKDFFSLSTRGSLGIGISVGVVGIAGVIAAYPLYYAMTERERRRLAPEILRLAEELLAENEPNEPQV